jgi:hypothetical protein
MPIRYFTIQYPPLQSGYSPERSCMMLVEVKAVVERIDLRLTA